MASVDTSELGIVVVGTGMMGTDHLRRIPQSIAGARVVTVVDADSARAAAAVKLAPGARTAASLTEALSHGDVGGVLIATPGDSHHALVLEALEARIPVLCEKPLTTDAATSRLIVEAEIAAGQRLIQVGFMRRFDKQFLEVKNAIRDGGLGSALVGRFVHRLDVAPPRFTEADLIPEAVVHEFDTARWLFDDEIESVEVLKPRANAHATQQLAGPQLIVIRLAAGGIVVVDANMDSHYGYEVSGEITLEKGTVEFGRPSGVTYRRSGALTSDVTPDYRARFVDAYNAEIQAFVDGVRDGHLPGPSAWDGYVATVVVDAGVAAQQSGKVETVSLPDKPAFYAE
ncbi:Gfo/Idh/MocA family protein [Rhodococcus koreensis]